MSLELGSFLGSFGALLERAGQMGPLLLDIAGRGVVVLALVGLVDLAMRRASAAARHWLWLLGVVGVVTLPLLSVALPRWRVLPVPASLREDARASTEMRADGVRGVIVEGPSPAVLEAEPVVAQKVINRSADTVAEGSLARVNPSLAADPAEPLEVLQTTGTAETSPAPAPQAVSTPEPVAMSTAPAPVIAASETSSPTSSSPAPASAPMPALARGQTSPIAGFSRAALMWGTVLAVWLAGTLLLLVRLLLGFLSLHALQQRCTGVKRGHWAELLGRLAAQMKVHGRIELLSSSTRAMPMTWGLWRTRVLLPQQAADWPAEQLRAVMLHELGHARRRDCLTQFLVQVACALYWPNPLVWLAHWRMQVERERACDDLVLNAGAKASAYAEHLLHSASEVTDMNNGNIFRFVGPAVAMARPSALEQRLRAILDPRRNRGALTPRGAIAAIVLLLMALLPVAVLHAAAPAGGGGGTTAGRAAAGRATESAAAPAGEESAAEPDQPPAVSPPARSGGGRAGGGLGVTFGGGAAAGGGSGGRSGGGGATGGFTAGPRGGGGNPPRSGDAGALDAPAVNLDATIYDLRIPAELIGRLDIDALTKAAASAEAFEKALSDLGTAKPLYRATQAVRLSGDMIRIGSQTPYVTNSQVTAQGQTINTIQYTSTGAIFNISGELEEVPPRINLALSIEISTLSEGAANITSTVKSTVFRNANLARNGFVELRQPFVILSIDGASADSAGKAVAYVARVSLSRPAAPGAAAAPPAPPTPIAPSDPPGARGARGAGTTGN